MKKNEKKDPSVAADRGTMEPIDKKDTGGAAQKIIILLLLGMMAILFFVFSSKKDNAPATKDDAYRISAPSSKQLNLPQEPPLDIAEPEPKPEPKPEPEPEGEIVTIAEIKQDNAILERKMAGGFSNVSQKSSNPSQSSSNQEQTDSTFSQTKAQAGNPEDDYDGQGVAKVTASKIINRSLIITQGTKIPCTLETALDSNVPGMTSCIVSNDIYSSDGLVRLIDRGSKLNGRYQGDLKRGQARIAILWERLETPEGVLINLSSPSTDPLGRAGASGYIDKHFWERFGNAIMLSLVSDAFQYLNYKQAESSKPSHLQDTQESTQNMAEIALENEINIAPTLHKNQGEPIQVFLNKDLSFEKVYKIDLKSNHSTIEEQVNEYLRK